MRYLYKPYHPWRHRFRRERVRKVFVYFLWILFLIGTVMIVQDHVHIEVTERIIRETKAEQNIYGIGVDGEKGEIFWFRRQAELLE